MKKCDAGRTKMLDTIGTIDFGGSFRAALPCGGIDSA